MVDGLNVKEGCWYIDATLGDGGHSLEILRRGGRVFGIDADGQAIERVRERFKGLGIKSNLFILVQGNFRDLKQLILQTANSGQIDQNLGFRGVLYDLGVSSLQLETPERGFSFNKRGSLDMRMDQTLNVTALDLIKILNKGELYELFSKIGEEKLSRRIADAVVSSRHLIKDTLDLSNLINREYKKTAVKTHINSATKVFQALRIRVNDELGAIEESLEQVLGVLDKDGCICVISFHSLEDRIVKSYFKTWADQGSGRLLIKKPITPTTDEVQSNPRSRSAKLRIFQKN